jgi:hypothetical protein
VLRLFSGKSLLTKDLQKNAAEKSDDRWRPTVVLLTFEVERSKFSVECSEFFAVFLCVLCG